MPFEMISILNMFIFKGLVLGVKVKMQELDLWIFYNVPLTSYKKADLGRFAYILPAVYACIYAHVCKLNMCISCFTEYMLMGDG